MACWCYLIFRQSWELICFTDLDEKIYFTFMLVQKDEYENLPSIFFKVLILMCCILSFEYL